VTLDEVMRMYEAEMEQYERDGRPTDEELRLYSQRAKEHKGVPPGGVGKDSPLGGYIDPEGNVVFELVDPFTLMFWRLYPDGDVVSGLDFDHIRILPKELSSDMNNLHRHNYLEISYVYKGSFAQEINGEKHEFHEGDVWIMDHNCMHREYRWGYDCFVVFVEIYPEFFDEMFSQAFKGNPAGKFIKEALMEKRSENRFIHFTPHTPSPEVERIFNYALEERERSLPGSEYMIKGLFISLFAILAANYSFSVTEKERKTLDNQVYREVVRYLADNCHDTSLETLSRTFFTNKTYMSRLIQSASGMTYKELLQDIRLERAAELLTGTADAVSDIANAVGYRNLSYFYQLFQKKYQVSPSEYRARIGQ